MAERESESKAGRQHHSSLSFPILAFLSLLFLIGISLVTFLRPLLNPRPEIAASNPSAEEPGQTVAPGKIGRVASAVTAPAPGTPTPQSRQQLLWANRASQLLQSSGQQQSLAAQKLATALATGKLADLRDLSREELEQVVDALLAHSSAEEVASFLETFFNIPRGYVNEPKAAVMGLLDATLGTPATSLPPAAVILTDRCESDGSISGSLYTIPQGASRVYAVFENDGMLKGLDHVLAIWRMPSDDRVVMTKCEPIHAGARYNYVWLQTKSGWPAGDYRLELCDPKNNSQLLATRGFSVE